MAMFFWLCLYVCGNKLNNEYQLTNHEFRGKLKFQDFNIVN